MKVSFCGIKPTYKQNNINVFPIENDIKPTVITKACQQIRDDRNYIGGGCNGSVYHLGQDLVIKKTHSNPLVQDSISQEARKLNMLYRAGKERNMDLQNTQKGIGLFAFKNGSSYLITTLVRGKEADFYNNPLNKKNLASLLQILTELDKGSPRYGRLMVFDLNSGNINFTKDKAGIFDMEYMRNVPFDKAIDDRILSDKNKKSYHHSDTSELESNIRSFEWGCLSEYLKVIPKNNARKLFKDYLNVKSNYHKQMAEFYLEQAKFSRYPEIFTDMVNSEKVHARILGKEKVSEDIIKSEALKIQISEFAFLTGRSCQTPTCQFNINQVISYYKDGCNYFSNKLEQAYADKDADKIVYYKNCLNMFNNLNYILKLKETMGESQRLRMNRIIVRTLDNIVC